MTSHLPSSMRMLVALPQCSVPLPATAASDFSLLLFGRGIREKSDLGAEQCARQRANQLYSTVVMQAARILRLRKAGVLRGRRRAVRASQSTFGAALTRAWGTSPDPWRRLRPRATRAGGEGAAAALARRLTVEESRAFERGWAKVLHAHTPGFRDHRSRIMYSRQYFDRILVCSAFAVPFVRDSIHHSNYEWDGSEST